MIAYITSIGEPTTETCRWSLERNGFEVVVVQDKYTTLAQKLKWIYDASVGLDFIRVDADVVVNKNLVPEFVAHSAPKDIWWTQYMTFDWYKQDLTHGGVQFIKNEALASLSEHIHEALDKERPESYMFRLKEFHGPRRCISNSKVVGIHGYAQKDMERVKATKARRNQYYDWELAERLNAL